MSPISSLDMYERVSPLARLMSCWVQVIARLNSLRRLASEMCFPILFQYYRIAPTYRKSVRMLKRWNVGTLKRFDCLTASYVPRPILSVFKRSNVSTIQRFNVPTPHGLCSLVPRSGSYPPPGYVNMKAQAHALLWTRI